MFENRFYTGFVLKRAATPDNDGSGEDSSVPTDVPFSGAIRKLRAREIMAGGKPTTLATHRIYCASTVVCTEDDAITFDGVTYTVVIADDVMRAGKLQQIDVEHRA